MVVSSGPSEPGSTSSANSSRNNRRRLLWVREYRANSAPFTTSGRLTRAKTGRSTLVKYRSRISTSLAVKVSVAYSMGGRIVTARPHSLGDVPDDVDGEAQLLLARQDRRRRGS